ncbi:putative toxin-antitoxin system antitoxin component [Hydrogenophaga sp. T4]|nr:putative toxin-antitoxin system antitoxin component [Hydrogenophaga sp. T4]
MARKPKIELPSRSAAAAAAAAQRASVILKGTASPSRRVLTASEKDVLLALKGGLQIKSMMVEAMKLGLDQVVSVVPSIELHDLAVGGLPTRMLSGYVATLHLLKEADVLNAIGISGRTIQRRQDAKLGPEPSAAAIDFATILNRATEVLGDRDLAERWMTEPALGLDGRKPIDLLSSRQGAALVKDHLTRMDYGVYA